ncbi:bifunctional 5,10-methylenetetrahydrofolate dehydrogenase/5,10-methenyltetrahydrofolate cyclohydrolase [Patescibacteria group bacterium]|nr:bifunctional 5,10-methylenetetrahydrofolate dehydrogenase/5,10-methenyltetrahydrofolate cyclohydrolase [Patescibacteria group bacterium]MDE1946429.1 bifunctional 5,10-methylenetetrahydrofolate dehydrogenase/5,10-methenyltetrahydrofolate cyclohydrolase [Patescibacteria group bacterium]MDE2011038.1 bifunctional 5,10-methylenetetrahydrofolate dehydrogenase/5,10-methenyltetrahydrofolate cyclohydrolase [Patescibacteria group bacterium]MDE2233628.1 bifunctional 5,10-methylenetetrahydrofolate dehydr
MQSIILDGRKAREAFMPQLVEKVKAFSSVSGNVPTLAIIQVGARADSDSYVRAKKAFAERIGAAVKHMQADENISETDLIGIVRECNAEHDIQGIIVQLPLPAHIDKDAVIDAIDPKKDADGLTAANIRRWLGGEKDAIFPATARGVSEIMAHYGMKLFGKKVVVIGRSMLVGKPVAAMCLNEGATVTICHSKTADLADETKTADIIISAAGKPGLVGKEHVRRGQVIIDVGISKTADGKLVGDVDFDAVKDVIAAITPVPGGVGPMTVLALFENLLDL